MSIIEVLENRLALAKKVQCENEGYCTYREAAIISGIDPPTIRVYANRGRLVKVKVGKKVFIHLDELGKLYATKTEKNIAKLREQLKSLGA